MNRVSFCTVACLILAIQQGFAEVEALEKRWRLGAVVTPAGVVTNGLAVRLGPKADTTVLYDLETGNWRAAWTGGFLTGGQPSGTPSSPWRPGGPLRWVQGREFGWQGGSVHPRRLTALGERVAIEYDIGGVVVRESPWAAWLGSQVVFSRDLQVEAAPQATITLTALSGPAELAVDGDVNRSPWQGYRKGEQLHAVLFDLVRGLRVSRDEMRTVDLTVLPHEQVFRMRLLYHFGPAGEMGSILAAVPDIGRFAQFSDLFTRGEVVVLGQDEAGDGKKDSP